MPRPLGTVLVSDLLVLPSPSHKGDVAVWLAQASTHCGRHRALKVAFFCPPPLDYDEALCPLVSLQVRSQGGQDSAAECLPGMCKVPSLISWFKKKVKIRQ